MDFETYQLEYLSEGSNGTACLICDKIIAQKRNIQRHFNDKHQACKPFLCPACRRMYKTKSSFREHVYRYHKDWKRIIDYDKFISK